MGTSQQDTGQALPAAIAAAVQAIRDDREHGASWLARAAARVLQQVSAPGDDIAPDTQLAAIRAAALTLASARPSMAAVANTAARIWDAGRTGQSAVNRQVIHEMAARLAAQDDQILHALTAHATELVTGVVYTISRSGTVEGVLRDLGRQHIERVIVAESRPGGEGVALGRALAASGLLVTLAPDAACGVFVGEATCVVLGADSLRADGSVVNKVGSYPLALVAQAAGKPVYVLCETLKIAAPDFPLTLEEHNPAELLPADAGEIANVSARNPYFDVTPAHLIASYITEEGILDRAAIARHARAAGAALAHLRAK